MSITQGEHTFESEVHVSGDNWDSYAVSEDVSAREPVAQSGNYEVELSTDAGPFTGVAAYNVSSGEEVPVIKRDCEVRIEVSEAISAGDALVPDGLGTFRQAVGADSEVGVAIANEDISSGEVGEVEIIGALGVTA